MPNPFTLKPVYDPRYFVAARGGRGALAAKLVEHLTQPDREPESVSLVGERRFGKTSMLEYLERAIAGLPNLLVAGVSLQSLNPATIDGFYEMLTESLILSEALSEESPDLDYKAFRRFLLRLKKRRQRLILLIDEFDVVARERRFEKTFFDNLRSMIEKFPLILVLASVGRLKDMVSQDVFTSPFWNPLLRFELGPLSGQEAEALITCSGSPDGLGEFVGQILDLAGFHPFFLQCACFTAWNLRSESGGGLDLDRLRAAFSKQVKPHYQYIWEHCDLSEQVALCALVEGKPVDATGLAALENRGYALGVEQVHTCGSGFTQFVGAQCAALPLPQAKGPGVTSPRPSRGRPLIYPIRIDAKAPVRLLALVVGVNHYLNPESGKFIFQTLDYAQHDAEEIAALLELLGFEVTLLRGPEATYTQVQAAFDKLDEATQGHPNPDSRFVFHFSGHGMLDPDDDERAYLALYDTDPNHPSAAALHSKDPAGAGLDVENLVYGLLPRVHVPGDLVVLDACHAGIAAGVKDLAPDPRALLNVTQQVFGDVRGRMLLAACPGNAQARELPELEHGVLTYLVLRHWRDLEGAHPPDPITFLSLTDYVLGTINHLYPDLPPAVWRGRGAGPFILRRIEHPRLPG